MAWIKIWSAPIVGKFLDPPLGKMNFPFNCAPDCTLSSTNFQQIYGEGAHRAPSPDSSLLNLDIRPRIKLCPQLTP